ncbi:MAG: porin family protein [Sphingobacteriaceae bacterium]
MKLKFTLFLGIILLLSSSAWAQVLFGVTGGVNASNMRKLFMGEAESGNYKIGYQAGAFAQIGITYDLSIQPELHFSQMGAKFTDSNNAKFTSEINYVTFPLLARVRLAEEIGLFIGPQVGYLISARDVYAGGNVDMKHYYKKTDFSVVLGAEYVTWLNVVLGARYQNSVSEVAQNTDLGPSIKNNGLTLSVGYVF